MWVLGLALSLLILSPVLPVGEMLQIFTAFDQPAGCTPGLPLAQHSSGFSEPPRFCPAPA